MDRRRLRHSSWASGVFLIVTIMGPLGFAGDASKQPVSKELVVKYLLATVHAFREVYVEHVVERLSQIPDVKIEPKEHWQDDPHALLLPFQFVKLAGAMIKDFEIGLVSLTPLYASNFPKTKAEVHALQTLLADPGLKVMTFADGNQYKGLMVDVAVEQSCADCHNHHPNSHKTDFKKGDVMGAIVVRLKP